MEHSGASDPPSDEQAVRRLAAELQQVEAAIALVANGEARRVTVGGLAFSEAIVQRLEPHARDLRVELQAVYWPEDRGCDVVVLPAKRDPDVEH